MKEITANFLAERRACGDKVEAFKKTFGLSAPITEANIERAVRLFGEPLVSLYVYKIINDITFDQVLPSKLWSYPERNLTTFEILILLKGYKNV